MECWKQAGKFQLCCIELLTKAVLQGQTLVVIRIWEFVSKCSCTIFLSVGMLSRKNSLNGICWKTPGAVNTPATFLPLATLHSTPPQGQQCECYCRTQHVHPSLWTSAVLWISPCVQRKSDFADGAFYVTWVGVAHTCAPIIVYIALAGITWSCLMQQVHVGLEFTVGWLHWWPACSPYAPVSSDSSASICIQQDINPSLRTLYR